MIKYRKLFQYNLLILIKKKRRVGCGFGGFVPLSRVFAVTENAPGSAQGSNDRGAGDQDKRTPE